TVLDQKEAAVRGRATVDYALYAAPPDGDAVGRLTPAGAFKVFMAESTGNLAVTVPRMEDILQAAAKSPKVVVIHAEVPGKFTKQKATDLRVHSEARPKIAEETAAATVARLLGEGRLRVAQLTWPKALDRLPGDA